MHQEHTTRGKDERSLRVGRDDIGEECDLEELQTPTDGREGHPHTSFYSQDILPSTEFCVLRAPVSCLGCVPSSSVQPLLKTLHQSVHTSFIPLLQHTPIWEIDRVNLQTNTLAYNCYKKVPWLSFNIYLLLTICQTLF